MFLQVILDTVPPHSGLTPALCAQTQTEGNASLGRFNQNDEECEKQEGTKPVIAGDLGKKELLLENFSLSLSLSLSLFSSFLSEECRVSW